MNLTDTFPIKKPPKEFDPYLDAAGKCFARFGWNRTNVPDIAREMDVSRATVYRNLGSISENRSMYGSRMINEVSMVTLAELQKTDEGLPQTIINAATTFVETLLNHPVANKIALDEPEIMGTFQVGVSSDYVDMMVRTIAPILKAEMDSGEIATRDPDILAQWIIRAVSSVITSPPPDDVRTYLTAILLPILTASKPAEAALD